MSTKNMWLAIVALIALLAVVAAFVFIKPDQSDRPQIQPPSVEDNVEDQRDEITGDNMTGVGSSDIELLPQPEDEDKDDASTDTQTPSTDNNDNQPVQDQDKDTETSKSDDTNKDEDTTPPATTPDDDDDEDVTPPSGSGNSGSTGDSNTPSSGTAEFNGSTIRAFPEGTNVNTIKPAKPFEDVYIGDTVWGWTGSEWVVVDTSTPPNQSTEIVGGGLSGEIVFH